MDAAYIFRVRFRFASRDPRHDPEEFEMTVRIPAVHPGEEGWLFFRDVLWRGEVNDHDYARTVIDTYLPDGIKVIGVGFRELEADEAYLDALRETIKTDLSRFRAESAREVLHKYFGSSIRIQ